MSHLQFLKRSFSENKSPGIEENTSDDISKGRQRCKSKNIPTTNNFQRTESLDRGYGEGGKECRRYSKTLVTIGSNVCNNVSYLVGTWLSLKRHQTNSPRQLILAIRNRDISRIRFVLDTCHVDANSCNSQGLTAIHEAALAGHWDIVSILLEYGADVNMKDKDGYTCLDYAVFGGHFDCARFLIEKGALVDTVENGMRSIT